MDWDKEIANMNYCGYCKDVTSVCNGYCFSTTNRSYLFNRLSHIEMEIDKLKPRSIMLRSERKETKLQLDIAHGKKRH